MTQVRRARFRVGHIAITALAVLLSTFDALAAGAPDPTIVAGRELSQLFLDGKTDVIWQRMTTPMQAALKTQGALAAFREQVGVQLGAEVEVLSEKADLSQGMRVYLRSARWSKLPTPVTMQWALDAQGRVAGFHVRPDRPAEAAPSAYLDYRTRANLRLPFDGEWFVFWGGRTLDQNYHAVDRGQRFANDLLKVVDGKSHRGDGRALDDYYCWNEKILAPADGRVVEAVDGLPDQAIGTTNTQRPGGNHVVLDLGNDEYAMLMHLRQGSVRVKAGDHVVAGAELGRCGNSGNTSEPHLHVHLQDQPRLGQGEGLPVYFKGYSVNGKTVESGELLRGQSVSMPSAME